MGKIVDRAQRRELISEAAERHRRLRGVRVAPRRSAACPTCGSRSAGAASLRFAGSSGSLAGSRAPGRLLS